MTAVTTGLTSDFIRAALGLEATDSESFVYLGVSHDSRTVGPGELFVALRGERHDAADFLPQVAERGARGAIVTSGREDASLPLEYFAVPDPLAALGDLAARARDETSATVVAITGSSGKTTVKEMIGCALSETRSVYRTEGNYNSQVGLPITILRADPDADTWVLEIGASEPGEIRRLTEIARPEHVVVTTVGAAHLEFFGDVEGVLHEKLDLARGPDSKTLVVGEEPAMLPEAALELREDAIVAGFGPGATYRPDTYDVGPAEVTFTRDGASVHVGAGGEHHLRDALIATAIAEALGSSVADAAAGLATYAPLGMRGAIRTIGGLTVLADCYNANPDSFLAAIGQAAELYPERRHAAFAGSMLELGTIEAQAHDDVGAALIDAGFALVAATGLFVDASFAGADERGLLRESDPADAIEGFLDALEGDEVVLVKGSRGARLERVIDALEVRFGGQV